MNKVALMFGLTLYILFLGFNTTNAASDPIGDHTLIDCINGDNDTGVAFDSTKPYQTLKAGIEKTIEHINTNINKAGNEATASGMVMNIKVKCSIKDVLNPQIDLKFYWKQYNNELIIEGLAEDALIIDDMYFYLHNYSWYITFKNAKFVNNKLVPYYFTGPTNAYHAWNKIIDSYIKLEPDTLLWSYRISNFNIENSQLNILISGNKNFHLPNIIKNSNITFSNITPGTEYIIDLREWNYNHDFTGSIFAALISNEINFWWNNYRTVSPKLFFINNKISNFKDVRFDNNVLYINNLFENTTSLNINDGKYMYNNLFTDDITHTYDSNNFRRNFKTDNISAGWLGWIFKRPNDDKYLALDLSSVSLYKEVTGQDIPNGLWEIYIILNY